MIAFAFVFVQRAKRGIKAGLFFLPDSYLAPERVELIKKEKRNRKVGYLEWISLGKVLNGAEESSLCPC